MNTKGQSLVAVLISVALMGIVMQGMMSMFSVAYHQQATVQRRAAWTMAQANVTQTLMNSAACGSTAIALANPTTPPVPKILLANNARLLAVGDQLAPGFGITAITLTPLGSPVVQSTTTTTVPAPSNAPCGHEESTTVTTTISTQQAQIGLAAQYAKTHQNYVASYVVNLTLTNGVVTGCQ